MLSPSGIVREPAKINAVIADVCNQLAPDVKRIFFNYGTDWSGDEAVHFRILISDDAARTRLPETMRKAIRLLGSLLDLESQGFFVYYKVRSESEQAVLREKSWEDAVS